MAEADASTDNAKLTDDVSSTKLSVDVSDDANVEKLNHSDEVRSDVLNKEEEEKTGDETDRSSLWSEIVDKHDGQVTLDDREERNSDELSWTLVEGTKRKQKLSEPNTEEKEIEECNGKNDVDKNIILDFMSGNSQKTFAASAALDRKYAKEVTEKKSREELAELTFMTVHVRGADVLGERIFPEKDVWDEEQALNEFMNNYERSNAVTKHVINVSLGAIKKMMESKTVPEAYNAETYDRENYVINKVIQQLKIRAKYPAFRINYSVAFNTVRSHMFKCQIGSASDGKSRSNNVVPDAIERERLMKATAINLTKLFHSNGSNWKAKGAVIYVSDDLALPFDKGTYSRSVGRLVRLNGMPITEFDVAWVYALSDSTGVLMRGAAQLVVKKETYLGSIENTSRLTLASNVTIMNNMPICYQQKDQNLTDLHDKQQFRPNLTVYKNDGTVMKSPIVIDQIRKLLSNSKKPIQIKVNENSGKMFIDHGVEEYANVSHKVVNIVYVYEPNNFVIVFDTNNAKQQYVSNKIHEVEEVTVNQLQEESKKLRKVRRKVSHSLAELQQPTQDTTDIIQGQATDLVTELKDKIKGLECENNTLRLKIDEMSVLLTNKDERIKMLEVELEKEKAYHSVARTAQLGTTEGCVNKEMDFRLRMENLELKTEIELLKMQVDYSKKHEEIIKKENSKIVVLIREHFGITIFVDNNGMVKYQVG